MLQEESQFTYDIFLEFHHFDKNGYFTPAGYHYILNSMVDKHLVNYDIQFERLLPKNLSWVILSLTSDIKKPINHREDKLIGKTWFSGRKGVVFRREVVIQNQDGEVILNASLYSTLIDLNTRSVYRSRELPFDLTFAHNDNLSTIAKPTFKEKHEYNYHSTQLVKRSFLDRVGHVNNLKYSEFCFDAFNEDDAQLKNINRMEIYFVSELKNDEEFNLNKFYSDNRLIIEGFNSSQNKPSFYGVFTYNNHI